MNPCSPAEWLSQFAYPGLVAFCQPASSHCQPSHRRTISQITLARVERNKNRAGGSSSIPLAPGAESRMIRSPCSPDFCVQLPPSFLEGSQARSAGQ